MVFFENRLRFVREPWGERVGASECRRVGV
jgi:hypothetical protein